MRFEKDGRQITCLDEWHEFAGPKRFDQWVEGRSAYELARAWCENGTPTMPFEVREILDWWEDTMEFTIERGFPEHRIPFDDHRGEPRNADLALIGTARCGRLAVTVEGKADEPFGPTVGEAFDAACERLLKNPSSKGVRRIEDLVKAILPPRQPGDSKLTDLRYQLLTAAAGTLAFATEQGATMGVLIVHEFRSDRTRAEKHRANNADFHAFVRRLAGQDLGYTKGLYGPFLLTGSDRMDPRIPLAIGKVRSDVRTLEHRRGPLLKGKTYEVVIRNVAKMTGVGYSLEDAFEIALKEAGLKTMPKKLKPISTESGPKEDQ